MTDLAAADLPEADLAVIEDAKVAAVALDGVRAQILAELATPGSATTVAKVLGLSRQKINYHLRILEDNQLVRFVENRQRRGLTERVMVASARSYVVSSAALGPTAAVPEQTNRLSSSYLIAVAARIVSEMAQLVVAARRAGQPLATLTIDTEIRFASAVERADFTTELAAAVTSLTSKYHDQQALGGRLHRLVVAAYPTPSSTQAKET